VITIDDLEIYCPCVDSGNSNCGLNVNCKCAGGIPRCKHNIHIDINNLNKGYWGNPCNRHENIVAWMAQIEKDNEGLHCFGCFIESRENAARTHSSN